MTFPIPGPPAPYLVENPNLSAQYLIPNFLLPYLSSWRWDYRRTALLYALANLDGPALGEFYRFALYYRALYSPQEVELLNLVALKLAGSRDYVAAARRQFGLMLRNGMRFAKKYARDSRKARSCGCGGSCGPCSTMAGFAFGIPHCHGYLDGPGMLSGDDLDDMLSDFDAILDDNTDKTSSDDDWGTGGDDDWGTGGSDDWGTADDWGSSGAEGWASGSDGEQGAANQKAAEDDWGSTWGTTKPKTTTTKKKKVTAPKSKPSSWWQALPAMVKTATDVATKTYCMANSSNPMCRPGAPAIQNTPQWISYCKLNANYPGCQTLLTTNKIALPTSAAKTPPPPPGTGTALVNQTGQWAQYYPIIGLVALAALGYLLLG